MKARISVLDVVISDSHAVLHRYVETFVAETVYVMIVRMRVLDRLRRAPCDPRFTLHQIRCVCDLLDRASGGHGFCFLSFSAAFGICIFPSAAAVFPNIGFRDLGSFQNDVPIPIGAIFSAEDVIDYAENPDKTTDPKYLDDDLCSVLQYAEKDEKTGQRLFGVGINHPVQRAYEAMTAVKRRFGKTGRSQPTHDVTPRLSEAAGDKR